MQSRVIEPATFLLQDAGSAPEPQPSDRQLQKKKTDHVVTILCVESLCHEVNMCVTLWSDRLTEVQEQVTERLRQKHHSLYRQNDFQAVV